MAFKGWPSGAIAFYEGLELDNSKTYWQAHRPIYDEAVKAPMEAMLADLAAEFGEGKVFRPYRDVRFSPDKTPYKLNCAAHLPGGYVSFSADGRNGARLPYRRCAKRDAPTCLTSPPLIR